MLDQLFNIVKQFGQDSVVNNPEVPNQYNQDVLQDATHTIAGGFQNILAGGGFQSILNMFKGDSGGASSGGRLASLVQNPIVNMMVGHFISKLVGKYNMNPSAASNVANQLIPHSINNLIEQTNDPGNDKATLDNFIGALVGKSGSAAGAAAAAAMNQSQTDTNTHSSPLQDLLEKFTGGNTGGSGSGGGFDLQNIISNLTSQAQNNMTQSGSGGGGGLMDIIKGLMG